jgi:hypothetical protein
MISESLTESLRAAFTHARNLNGSLAERLAVYSDAIRQLHSAYARAVDDFVARLNAGGAGVAAPQPGEPMPPFVLPDETGRLTSLADVTGNGPAVVMFHRGHWCPWCRVSFEALAHAYELAAARGKVLR